MDYFTADKVGRSVVLRLDQGDLVLESIEKVLEETGIQQGVVISGIGTLDQSVLHMVTTTGYPAVEYFDKKVDQPLEVVSIQGYIADGMPHLHMMISDRNGALGGHLEHGCRTLYLCEIVIMEYLDIDVQRMMDKKQINKLVRKERP
jgi:hypothetical protein